MKIKTTSWHYRFLKRMGHKPKNLCSYVWTLFANVILCFAAMVVATVLVFGAVKLTIDTNGIFLLVALGGMGVIFGTAFGYTRVKKSDNLVLSWIRAKKSKMCPMIEYVDHE